MKTKQELEKLSPQKALDILIEGNKRFCNDVGFDYKNLERVNMYKNGQNPFAVIVTCMDSRVPAEIVFDKSIGDLFVIRVAGNIINEDVLGSIEYACDVVGSKLVMVLGHTKCGAVIGACDQVELGNLTQLLKKINPAINQVKQDEQDPLESSDFVEKVISKNVAHSMQVIKMKSPVIEKLLSNEQVLLVGAVYDVNTGKVHLLE